MKLRMIGIIAAAAIAAVTTASIADEAAIKARKDLMKGIGEQAKVLGGMLKGEVAFDAAAAKAALQAVATNAADFPNHFPEGSDAGDTASLPAIWANKADFDAKAKKFADDAAAAVTAVDGGEDAFKAAAGAMFGNCKSCHEPYRKPS